MFILPDDSFLRNPPASTEPKQLVAIDGLRYIFDMLGISYAGLIDEIYRLSVGSRDTPLDRKLVTSVFLNAWSIVDNLHRLYQLLQHFPRLKRTPNLEIYLRAISDVESLRHGIQHLDERLSECVSKSIPLWGTLGWFYTPGAREDSGTAMFLIPGAIRSGNHQWINPIGKSYSIPIGLITLDAFGKNVNLSDLIDRTKELAHALDQSFKKSAGTVPGGQADILITVDVMFKDPPPDPPLAKKAD